MIPEKPTESESSMQCKNFYHMSMQAIYKPDQRMVIIGNN